MADRPSKRREEEIGDPTDQPAEKIVKRDEDEELNRKEEEEECDSTDQPAKIVKREEEDELDSPRSPSPEIQREEPLEERVNEEEEEERRVNMMLRILYPEYFDWEKEPTEISMVVEEWAEGQTSQYSPVYHIDGFPFRLRMDRDFWGSRGPYIECLKSNEAELWKCTATVFKNINRPRGKEKGENVFCSWEGDGMGEDCMRSMTYAVGTTVAVVIAGKEGPNSWSSATLRPLLDSIKEPDGIIVIGNEKKEIQVNKEFLSSQSPYFDRLFKEENVDKISIGDVKYEEFNSIIKMVYGTFSRSRWRPDGLLKDNVLRVLELADRFELKIVKDIVTSYLFSFPYRVSNSPFSLARKLLLSEEKNVPFLKKLCLENSSKDQLLIVKKSKEYAKFSDELKAEILDRMQN